MDSLWHALAPDQQEIAVMAVGSWLGSAKSSPPLVHFGLLRRLVWMMEWRSRPRLELRWTLTIVHWLSALRSAGHRMFMRSETVLFVTGGGSTTEEHTWRVVVMSYVRLDRLFFWYFLYRSFRPSL